MSRRTGQLAVLLALAVAVTYAVTSTVTSTGAVTHAVTTSTQRATVYHYADASPAQTVRVVRPRSAVPGAPWVMTIRGGAWAYGNPAEENHADDVFADAGYEVFTIGYRSTRVVPWSAQWSDVDTAWRWIRSRAARFGIDPDRGVAYGFSAGGQLAAMLGNREPSVRAVVTVSGALEPWQLAWDAEHLDGRTALPHELTVYGWVAVALRCPYTPSNPDCRSAWTSFYPSTYLSASAPPTLMFAGTADGTIPDTETTGYARLLARRHVPESVVLVPGMWHDETIALDNAARQRTITTWLRNYDAARTTPDPATPQTHP